jgi:hypothetical protein
MKFWSKREPPPPETFDGISIALELVEATELAISLSLFFDCLFAIFLPVVVAVLDRVGSSCKVGLSH